jgi:hypothetical protein
MGAADPEQQIQSLYRRIVQHVEKIENNPLSQDVPHWETELRTWINEILRKAGKVTQKRRPGALDKYLLRVLGVTGSDLENLLGSPLIILNPCVINPSMPLCTGASSGVPPSA